MPSSQTSPVAHAVPQVRLHVRVAPSQVSFVAQTIEQVTHMPSFGSQTFPLGQLVATHGNRLQVGPSQTPLTHSPEQQFAFDEQSCPVGLQAAHVPLAQTPLQHWFPL